jgi:hypothetical protein
MSMPICIKCNSRFPNRIQIEGKIRNICKRKFCLNCSPFNQHNTSKNPTTKGYKFCPHCNRKRLLKYFYLRKNKNPMSWCIECVKINCAEIQKSFKIKCVQYKGGKCEKCSYNRCVAAFDFHHIDPTKKLFNVNTSCKKGFTTEVKEELDKCMLLCATCHRELHYFYQDSNQEF